jgi:NDP-sugar pyrophosphorylase family protein
MRTVILAGGKGTRLRPFTTTIPKPLVPIGDMTIMEILVRQLADQGCSHITVAVSHLAQIIMAYFGDGSRWGIQIDYSIEEKPLSTIGPLRLIKDLPEDFLVMNGDILTDLNFGEFFDEHLQSQAIATVATYERDIKIDFGVLRYDNSSRRIEGFTEKPTAHFSVSMGVYAFSRKILDIVPEGEPYGFDNLMIDLINQGSDVRAHPFDGYWMDIGRPDDFDRANVEFTAHRSSFLRAHSS